jgi:hypothetical protein
MWLTQKTMHWLWNKINLHKKNIWEMIAYCDNDHARNKDGRKSVPGVNIYVFRCLISWKSKSQKLATLSSEYVSFSEMCAEIRLCS